MYLNSAARRIGTAMSLLAAAWTGAVLSMTGCGSTADSHQPGQTDASSDAPVATDANSSVDASHPDASLDGPPPEGGDGAACTPKSCAQAGFNCGTADDACGGSIDCGACPGGQTCGAGGPNLCGSGCNPKTCVQLNAGCGAIDNGCGEPLDCGACFPPDTCAGAGKPNSCGCACALPHATASCLAGACSVATCDLGWANCDGDDATGCETSTDSDVANCGLCGFGCTLAAAEPLCDAGVCAIAACAPGYADCDGEVQTGCETNLDSNPANCGACGIVCPATGGTAVCVGGTCGMSTCSPGLGDCDDTVAGCETDLASSVPHCGFCDNPCAPAFAVPLCSGSACLIGSCVAGRGDCDGIAADGCEIDVTQSLGNCGGCDQPCPIVPNASPSCVDAFCTQQCLSGFADCDGVEANGCEVDLLHDVEHCGSCETGCTYANGQGACMDGSCVLTACGQGYGDCNQVAVDGCETGIDGNALHCGACGHSCLGAPCSVGLCQPTTLVAGQTGVNSIGVNGTHVVYTIYAPTSPGGSVRRVTKAGASLQTLATGTYRATNLALDGTHAYWAESELWGRVGVAKLDGTSASYWGGASSTRPYAVAVDDQYLYWTQSNGQLMRHLKPSAGSGADQVLLTTVGAGTRLAADPGTSGELFWIMTNAVRKAGKDGTGYVELLSGLTLGSAIVVDSTTIYFASGAGVQKVPRSGGAPTVLAPAETTSYNIALDATSLYWATASGTVRRVRKDGTGLATLAQGQSSPAYVAVDPDYLYWSNVGSGTIARVAK